MTSSIPIAAIAAMSRNRVIGVDNGIPWHLPADLKFFKAQTMGKPVIMGRKTFESILSLLGKPMPGRHSIIVSRGDYKYDGINTHASLESALAEARAVAAEKNCDEIIIGGGAQIYELAMPLLDRLYLTEVLRDYEGDAYFPTLDDSQWLETLRVFHDDDPPFVIRTLERR